MHPLNTKLANFLIHSTYIDLCGTYEVEPLTDADRKDFATHADGFAINFYDEGKAEGNRSVFIYDLPHNLITYLGGTGGGPWGVPVGPTADQPRNVAVDLDVWLDEAEDEFTCWMIRWTECFGDDPFDGTVEWMRRYNQPWKEG